MIKILDKSFKTVGILSNEGNMTKRTPYFDDEYVQTLSDGAETFSFSTLGNCKYSPEVKIGNYIAFADDEGDMRLFQIVEVEELHEEDYILKAYCEMASMELLNEVVRPMKVVNSNPKKFLETLLSETDWKVGRFDDEIIQIVDFEITDHTTIYSCIQEYLIGKYEAEVAYRVEFQNNQLVNRYIDVYKERGKVNEKVFYYGKNLSSVSKTVDSSELCTRLIGVGTNNIDFKTIDKPDKPLNQDFVESKDAFEKYNQNGSHITGIFKAETDSPAELYELTKKELERRIEPKITYELKTELLGSNIGLGDTVKIVDHELGIYLTGRVVELKTHKTDRSLNECTLANFKEVQSKISSFDTSNIISEIKGYLDSLELGILTQTAIDTIKTYLTALGLSKAEIDAIFETLKLPDKIEIDDGKGNGNYDDSEVPNNGNSTTGGNDYLTTLTGDKQDIVMKDGKTYNCGTLKSLKFSLPSTPSKTYSSQITFRTTKNTTPTIFDQSDIVWLTGEHCIRGALLPRPDTTYTITIKYNSNTTIPRKYRGTVKYTSHGGSYKSHPTFSGGAKVLELAKSYYDVRSKFKYKTTTPLSKFASGTPASNKSKWYTGGKYHIDCSTYINQIFRGRGYKNSIYYNSDKYGISTTSTYSWATNLGRYASEIAKTCVKNGWHLTDIKSQKDWTKLKSGDLVFWSSRSNNADRNETVNGRYMQVGHVAVIRTVKSDGFVTTFEVSTPSGTVLNRSLAKNYPEKILFFARIRK